MNCCAPPSLFSHLGNMLLTQFSPTASMYLEKMSHGLSKRPTSLATLPNWTSWFAQHECSACSANCSVVAISTVNLSSAFSRSRSPRCSHRQCAVKHRNGGLCEHRQRNRCAGQRLIRQNRRDAYDMAGLLFAHLRGHFLRDENVTRNVCANHQLKVRRHIVSERLINVDARVVDQEINVVKVFDGGIGHFYGSPFCRCTSPQE